MTIKEYGKTSYGSVTFEEFNKMLDHPYIEPMKNYLISSHVMDNKMFKDFNYGTESQSYFTS